MSNLVNLVQVEVDPAVRDQLLDKLWVNVHAARKEKGCFQFEVSQKKDDPNTFIFYEVYKDEAALAWHRNQRYFIEYMNFINDMNDKVTRSHDQLIIIDK